MTVNPPTDRRAALEARIASLQARINELEQALEQIPEYLEWVGTKAALEKLAFGETPKERKFYRFAAIYDYLEKLGKPATAADIGRALAPVIKKPFDSIKEEVRRAHQRGDLVVIDTYPNGKAKHVGLPQWYKKKR